ncbi:MAG: hypothetical protein OXU64_06140 [Gemmatimonadota bacterium]|nr:hypothetical protein [Gemmatimonadota bacterium]
MTELPTAENGSNGRGGAGAPPGNRALDPEIDPNGWEDLVARIVGEARPLLQSRRRRSALARSLAEWRRPVIAASAGLAAAAAAALLLVPGYDPAPVEASFDEVVVPWSVAAWMDGSHAPTVEELVLAMDEYSP